MAALNGERTFAKRQRKEAQLVEHAAKRPDVGLRCNRFVCVEVYHFGCTIRQGGVFFDLLLHGSDAVCLRIQYFGCGRAEIAQHKVAIVTLQNVLNLKISMNYGRVTMMEAGYSLGDVTEYHHHFSLSESRLQATIHHGQHVVATMRHQQQNLVHTVTGVCYRGVHIVDDVLVAAQVALEAD